MQHVFFCVQFHLLFTRIIVILRNTSVLTRLAITRSFLLYLFLNLHTLFEITHTRYRGSYRAQKQLLLFIVSLHSFNSSLPLNDKFEIQVTHLISRNNETSYTRRVIAVRIYQHRATRPRNFLKMGKYHIVDNYRQLQVRASSTFPRQRVCPRRRCAGTIRRLKYRRVEHENSSQ